MKHVGIIGGGIIGLSSAYYLIKSGHQVTIIDKGDLTDGCSFGNAGMIVPSHFIPLAAPGMISKGIRWMFNSKSPFYVRPRVDLDLLKWGYQFYKHSNEEHVSRSGPALRDLSLLSRSLYSQLQKELPFDFGYHEHGLMMLYKEKSTEEEEKETAHAANKLGIEARVLSAAEVQKLEPDVKVDVRGGVYFPGDTHLTPQVLVKGLIDFLKKQNVEFITSAEITDVQFKGRRIEMINTRAKSYSFDEYVLAAGSWSGELGKKLRLNLPMQAGKGYSFTLDHVTKNLRIPSILLEARVAVTPMGDSLRFGGTMEIGGINHDINTNRVRGIVESIPKYFPEMIFHAKDAKGMQRKGSAEMIFHAKDAKGMQRKGSAEMIFHAKDAEGMQREGSPEMIFHTKDAKGMQREGSPEMIFHTKDAKGMQREGSPEMMSHAKDAEGMQREGDGIQFPEKIWHGLRPCSPDGLPFIGRTIAVENLVVATGHSMMGMSLGPATGKVVSDVMDGKKPDVDITLFAPERFA